MTTYERGLQLATERGAPVLRGAADMHVGMSETPPRAERSRRRTAAPADAAGTWASTSAWPQNPYRWRVAMARIRDRRRRSRRSARPARRGGPAVRERLLPECSTDRRTEGAALDRAGEVARRAGLGARAGPVGRGRPQLRARVRAHHARPAAPGPGAQGRSDDSPGRAMGLLERLLQAAEEGQRTGSVIEILVLQALAHQVRGDVPGALVPLGRALALAEPEGYVRVFLDEGPPMAALLERGCEPRNRAELRSSASRRLPPDRRPDADRARA